MLAVRSQVLEGMLASALEQATNFQALCGNGSGG